MSTVIRPEVSRKNPYYISRHRYYELKHFCLQYPEWRKACLELGNSMQMTVVRPDEVKQKSLYSDPTGEAAVRLEMYRRLIDIVEEAVQDTQTDIEIFLLKSVTEGLSYTYLHTSLGIPCGKRYFYDTCRRFWWVLDKKRDKNYISYSRR